MQRTSAGRLAGGACPVRGTAAAIRAGMSPGGRNAGSSGSIVGPPAGSSPAAMSSAGSCSGLPASSHVRSDSWSSQRPITLRR